MLLVELGSRAGVYQSMPFERLVLPISGLQVALSPSLCFSGLVQGRGVWKMYKIRLVKSVARRYLFLLISCHHPRGHVDFALLTSELYCQQEGWFVGQLP